MKKFVVFALGILIGISSLRAVSIYDASFDSGGAVKTTGSQLLDNFIVLGLYNGNMAFIWDGETYGRIYNSSWVDALVIGGEYSGVTVTSSAYYDYSELISPSGGTLESIDNSLSAATISVLDIATLSSTTTLSASPSLGSNWNLESALVTFTFTPLSNAAPASGSVFITDEGGTTIQFYRSVTTDELIAGQNYTVTGFVQGYNGAVEIVGASFTPVPEPSTYVLIAAAGLTFIVFRRRRRVAL